MGIAVLSEINLDLLREYLSYNNETGIFTWIKSPNSRKPRLKNSIAGVVNNNGYIQIGWKGQYYWAHRLAWLFTYNHWPTTIDHINRLKTDNRICNLRDVSLSENCYNRLSSDNVRVRK